MSFAGDGAVGVSAAVSYGRRSFLQQLTKAAAARTLLSLAPWRATGAPRPAKAVVVTFGGGARDDETFSPDGRENIPNLLGTLMPQGTFFTRVMNRGILGHYVANASLATGVYETFNNFSAVPPPNPTAFEYFRKDLKRPGTDAWVIAPANGFHRIGESSNRSYGPAMGAGVVLPKRLLGAVLSGKSAGGYEHLLQDNYETPLYAPELNRHDASIDQLERVLKVSVSDFAAHARNLASPDELSVYVARQLMQQYAPSLLWITLHDIDIAHSGTFSLYLEAIRRTDRLCAELWNLIKSEPEYSGKTTMFILPDFGRDADEDAGGNGFQHHRTGDARSRTTWLMTLGAGIRENIFVDRPVESIDLVPTLGELFGFSPHFAQGRPLVELF